MFIGDIVIMIYTTYQVYTIIMHICRDGVTFVTYDIRIIVGRGYIWVWYFFFIVINLFFSLEDTFLAVHQVVFQGFVFSPRR